MTGHWLPCFPGMGGCITGMQLLAGVALAACHATEAEVPLKLRAAFISHQQQRNKPACSAQEAFPEIRALTPC